MEIIKRLVIDFFSLLCSLIISIALMMVVLSTGPDRRENRVFALFAGTEVLWNISAILLRFSMLANNGIWEIPTPMTHTFWFRLTANAIGVFSILSLYFTAVLLKKQLKWVHVAVLSSILFVLGLNFINKPIVVSNVRFNAMGLVIDDVQPFGWFVIMIITGYMLAAIILILKQRNRTGMRILAAGLIIIMPDSFSEAHLTLSFPPCPFSM